MMIITLFLLVFSQIVSAGTNLSCVGFPKSYSLTFNSDIIFIKSAIEAKSQNELISSSIAFQNLYVYPEMPLLQQDREMLRWGGFEKKDLDITVVKTEEIKLPYSIEIDSKIPTHYPDAVQIYLNKILSRKKIEKGEAALRVSYQAKVKVDLCQKRDEVYQTLNWPIPKDPYLGYFLVPVSQRIKLKSLNNASAITNPCASINQIGSKGQIDPWSYWFFWSPKESGQDDKGKPFNCANILSEGIQWEDPKPKMVLIPNEHSEPGFSALREKTSPLKMSFIYSAFHNYDFKSYSADDKTKINGIFKNIITTKENQFSVGQIQSSLKGYDPALNAAMMFLWNLKRNSLFKKYAINLSDNKIEIIIRGVFKLSLKNFEIKIFIAPNQLNHPGHEDFKLAMSSALLNDDVVVYTGHAGFGSLLGSSLRKLRENISSNQASPPYQFVALFTCAASLYYPEENFAKPTLKNYRRDYVHSIATLKDGSSLGATLILGLVDQSLRQDKWPAFEEWVKTARYDNFIKLKTVEKKDE